MCRICNNKYSVGSKILGPFILDISNCYNIEYVPEYKDNIIKTLICNNNKKLQHLPEYMPCLEKLYLYFLKSVSLPNYSNLLELKLINVNVTSLPADLSQLETLYIQCTDISILPVEMQHLKKLTINSSPISTIPNLKSLEFLQVFRSRINTLNRNLISLRVLNLSLALMSKSIVHIS